jgi:HlyD family secretion protein
MNQRRIIISIIIILVLVGGGYWGYTQFLAPQSDTADSPTPDVNDITVDTGVDTVSAEGEVVPLADTQLAFQLGGQIAEILATEGESVAAGDPLLRLDNRDQQIALRQAETAVAQAETQLAAALAGQEAARVGLEAAQVRVRAAEAQLALLTADPTEEQIAVEESGVAVAQARVEQAAGSRDVVLEGATAAAIAAAEAELEAAEAEWLAVRIATDPIVNDEDADEEDQTEAQLRRNAAVAAVNAAQAKLDDLRAGANANRRQAAASGVAAASAQAEAAQAQFDLLLAGTRPEQIAVAEAEVEGAQRAAAEAELRVEQAETAVSQAEAGLAEAETAADQAQALLDKTTLTAPFAGSVADLPVKVGAVVQPGMPVAVMADFSEWRIETTDLTELNVVTVARGDAVEVTIDAFPGETWRGEVVDIARIAQERRGDVTYTVTIALAEAPEASLRWGMTAFVTVDVE